MTYNPKLVDYIRAGLSRGFREDHIADVLRKHGHADIDIREAMSHARPEQQPPNRNIAVSVAVFTVLLLVGLLALGKFTNTTPTAAVTGNAVGYEASRAELDALQQKVDKQQADLDAALAEAHDAELSAAEKDKLLAELTSYYEQAKEEREATKSALFDLWTFLFSKKAVAHP